MSSGMLPPGAVVHAGLIAVDHEDLSPDQVVSGSPTTAAKTLGAVGDIEIGIWEMTQGTATDTEIDEVFVVLSGAARVRFVDPALPEIEIGPGDVVRLSAGMHTEWTVTQTLRKIYLA